MLYSASFNTAGLKFFRNQLIWVGAGVFGGGAADSVDDVARMTGTINYEVLCDVGRRVQRVYVENGAEVELVDYLKGE